MAKEKQQPVHITKINIHNVMSIEEMELEPGTINLITGKNGQGKTSTLRALQSVFDGSNLATLVRNGSEQSKVVLELSDGGHVEQTTTEGKTGRKLNVTMNVNGQKFKVQNKAEYIKSLSPALGYNPIEFVYASDKERLNVLLEVMDVKLTKAQTKKIAGGIDGVEINTDLAELNPAGFLDDARTQYMGARREVNRRIRDTKGVISTTETAIPQRSTDAIKAEKNKAMDTLGKLQDAYNQAVAEAKDELNRDIDATKRELETRIEELRREAQEYISKREAETRDELTKLAEIHNEQRMVQRSNIDALENELENNTKYEQLSEMVEAKQAELEADEMLANNYTSMLDYIEETKAETMRKMPVEKLTVENGVLCYDGVEWSNINTAKQMEIAVNVGVKQLENATLRVVFLDGFERLDTEARNAMVELLKKHDIQAFLAEVNDKEMEITTVE